jgi:hypothetical protein
MPKLKRRDVSAKKLMLKSKSCLQKTKSRRNWRLSRLYFTPFG